MSISFYYKETQAKEYEYHLYFTEYDLEELRADLQKNYTMEDIKHILAESDECSENEVYEWIDNWIHMDAADGELLDEYVDYSEWEME